MVREDQREPPMPILQGAAVACSSARARDLANLSVCGFRPAEVLAVRGEDF